MSSTGRRISAQGDLDGACFLYSIVNAYAALCGSAPSFGNLCAALAQVEHPGDFLNPSVGTTGHYDLDYALLQRTIERTLALLGGEGPDSQHSDSQDSGAQHLDSQRSGIQHPDSQRSGIQHPDSQRSGTQSSPAPSPPAQRFHVQRIEGPLTVRSAALVPDARSVVILRYQGSSHFADDMDHWVCAVAHDAALGCLYVACSVRHQRACIGAPCGYEERHHPEVGRWSNDQLCPERAHTLVEGEAFRVRLEG